MDHVRVAALAEVPEGELRSYELPSTRVAVAHIENEIFALGDECTHAGCSLSDGEIDEEQDTVICPCHGSAFDVRTGEPLVGPAEDRVPVFPARVVDGWVEVLPRAEGES